MPAAVDLIYSFPIARDMRAIMSKILTCHSKRGCISTGDFSSCQGESHKGLSALTMVGTSLSAGIYWDGPSEANREELSCISGDYGLGSSTVSLTWESDPVSGVFSLRAVLRQEQETHPALTQQELLWKSEGMVRVQLLFSHQDLNYCEFSFWNAPFTGRASKMMWFCKMRALVSDYSPVRSVITTRGDHVTQIHEVISSAFEDRVLVGHEQRDVSYRVLLIRFQLQVGKGGWLAQADK
ncbi:hypothetical protein Q9233_016653 [Columba guinea]|nr:hypothetical protein Q9233_016653 [Columba guinea]